MKVAHLVATILALMLAASGLVLAEVYVHSLEARDLRALALLDFDQKNEGAALQRVAFEQPNLLVLYGSSEVNLSGILDKDVTGFAVFRTGGGGTDDIIYLQELASIGRELRGKKVAISFAPGQFYFPNGVNPDYYAGYFSRLHAYETAFSLDLSFGLKQAIARRMWQFPTTLASDPLLQFAVQQLADGSPQSIALYDLIFPLGRFQTFVLNLQDDWETWKFLERQPKLNAGPQQPAAAVDWNALVARAESAATASASNNQFGFENTYWQTNAADLTRLKGSESDDKFRARMARSVEWGDLELLLRVLKELGAHPLILSTPMPGAYYDYLGISRAARQEYYSKVEALGQAYGAEVVDFADHDEDKYFVRDRWSHPSLLGAVYYQQALDRFYHQQWSDSSFSSAPGN